MATTIYIDWDEQKVMDIDELVEEVDEQLFQTGGHFNLDEILDLFEDFLDKYQEEYKINDLKEYSELEDKELIKEIEWQFNKEYENEPIIRYFFENENMTFQDFVNESESEKENIFYNIWDEIFSEAMDEYCYTLETKEIR